MINSQELFDTFREDIVDVALPYLWTNAEVVRYADAAYRMFVRLTGGIPDFTSDATRIAITTGEDVVEYDTSILRIKEASLASDASDVAVINHPDARNLFSDYTEYGQYTSLSRKNTPGRVRYIVTGMERHKAKLIQIPEVDDELQLVIYRLPLNHIVDGAYTLSEVDEDHHLYLLDWMKHLAYAKQDAETFDKVKSKEFGDKFSNYCLLSKAEWEREKHKTRVVEYGGL